MKTIFKIAKNELRNLFYSPVAWLLAIVFMVMCAYFYTNSTYVWAKGSYLLFKNDSNLIYRATESVTRYIFFEGDSIFFNVLQNIYLFVPLLTMSIISREFNNGTIKLLYSSPIKLRQMVLGKYFALMIYNLLLVSIIGIFIVSGFFDIKSLDYGPLLSAALGFYLLLCALTAIGLFMSSLTVYPIVSAIASFTVLFILMYIGRLWQQYDFIRDMTWFLSITGRTEKMIAGLITTKDVFYYLVIIYLFMGFTLLKLRGAREAKPWYIKMGRWLAIIASGLLIGYISSRQRLVGYWDTTARKTNTIHPRAQQVLKELGDDKLEVTLYTNLLGDDPERGLPRNRNMYLDYFWEPYQRFKRDIIFNYEYYYDVDTTMAIGASVFQNFPGKTLQQIAKEVAKVMRVDIADFKTPEEMRKLIDLRPEGYAFIMQLKYKGRTEFLRIPGDWPTAMNVLAALERLLGTKMPKVVFTSGELQRSIYKAGAREYSNARELVDIGFDVDIVNLKTQDIPPDATTLVLADPKMDLTPTVQDKLKSYINNGGNMLILGEPGKQYILNPILQQLGVQLMAGQLVQPTYNNTPDNVVPYLVETGFNLAEEGNFLWYKYLWSHKSYYDTLWTPMPKVTGFSYTRDSGFTVTPLIITPPESVWLKMGKLVADSSTPAFSPQEGDIKMKSFPTAIQLTRQINNKEQRIILCGDADFISNKGTSNSLFLPRTLYSWLNYNRFPIYTPFPNAKDNIIILSPSRAAVQKIVYVWALPGIALLLGTVLLIRRKRK